MTALHPRGTLRARAGALRETDEVFRRLGIGARGCDLGDEGLYLAEELVAADRWFNGSDPEVLGILVLALMIAQRQGSTRIPLDPKGRLKTLVSEILRVAGLSVEPSKILKRITALTSAPQFNSVIGIGDARLPLIVDDGCLYTERTRWLEQRVAERLVKRLVAPVSTPAATGAIAELAARPGTRPLSIEQLGAVELALGGALTIVTGGPGTGKTLVAAAIVRGLARLGVTHIALAAQTGKAANRLTDVIGQELAAVGSAADAHPADRALAAAPPIAQTLHRLLGYRGDGFSHHAQSPLPVGALLVDEASMVDLEVMDALLDALPATAPLILIGDAHQLPAIDAGQILADLAVRDDVASARVGFLEHSYRMDASDPRGRAVLEAARAIHAGEAQRLVGSGNAAGRNALATARTPGTLTWSGCEWVDTAGAARPLDVAHGVAAALWHHFDGPAAHQLANDRVFRFTDGRIADAQHDELERLWTLLSRARVLTVTRALPTGSLALNAYLHDLTLDRMTVTGRPEFVPGEPVMITANDYQRSLFNGDQGMIVRADEGGDHHRYRAVFRVGIQLVPFAIEALRDRLELAWALTVHKSQGSELDALALVLPEEPELPLLTRELLYTGVTRARTSVVLCGSRPALVAAGKRGALRDSGLAARMRATLASR